MYELDIYLPVKHIYQQGATCGLVVICMCITYFFNKEIPLEDVFERAVSLKLTKIGEIFSASNLAILARSFGLDASIKAFNSICVRDELSACRLIAIPYDKDKNNQPALLQGRQSHWALCCGVKGDLVACLHGKSRLMGVWKLTDLVASNSQLIIPNDLVKDKDLVCGSDLEELRGYCVMISQNLTWGKTCDSNVSSRN